MDGDRLKKKNTYLIRLAQYRRDELVRERLGGASGVLTSSTHRHAATLVQLILKLENEYIIIMFFIFFT